jgi:outer membrane biosynthesis protein TonB
VRFAPHQEGRGDMKNSYLILQNSHGETARVLPFTREELEIIYRHDLKRIEIVRNSKELTDEGIQVDKLGEVTKSSPVDQVVLKGAWGQIRHVQSVAQVTPDVSERKEQNRDFIFFIKWTAGIQVSLLLLTLLIGWWIHRQEQPESQVVTVFKKEDLIEKKVPVVKPSTQKIKPVPQQAQVIPKKSPKVQPKKVVINQPTKVKTRNERAGNDLNRMGALSALGGMDKNSNGPGGLSRSASKSGGYGFDSSRARGGSERGLLGHGLVQAGIGGGENLSGYGGYGTKGKGQGQAGYGSMKMAGSSGGYYLPMSEEATVEGGLHPDQINAVIRRNQGQVIYCYERGLQTKPDLSGRVAVNFVISPGGQVSAATVAHTSLSAKQVESCILGKLRAWRFPKPKGNVAVKVTYPFLLKRLNQG